VLVKAYKSAVDNKKQTGVGVITVPYMKEMDQIFGDKPTISNPFSAHVGDPPSMFNRAATSSTLPAEWVQLSSTSPSPQRKKRKSIRELSEEAIKQRRELLDLLAQKQKEKNKREEERTLLFKNFLEDIKKKL